MCATIAATAVQITTTQIATAMAAEISDIVSSFTLMILGSVRFVVVFRAAQPDGGHHWHHNRRSLDRQSRGVLQECPTAGVIIADNEVGCTVGDADTKF